MVPGNRQSARLCQQYPMPLVARHFCCHHIGIMTSLKIVSVLVMICYLVAIVDSHGPPQERDKEDISMGRKMGAKWCGMAKVCNHDRVPVCGMSHAGDIMGFRDLCDMFDFNCIRRRNYKQTSCPDDKTLLTASRRPTSYYED